MEQQWDNSENAWNCNANQWQSNKNDEISINTKWQGRKKNNELVTRTNNIAIEISASATNMNEIAMK